MKNCRNRLPGVRVLEKAISKFRTFSVVYGNQFTAVYAVFLPDKRQFEVTAVPDNCDPDYSGPRIVALLYRPSDEGIPHLQQ